MAWAVAILHVVLHKYLIGYCLVIILCITCSFLGFSLMIYLTCISGKQLEFHSFNLICRELTLFWSKLLIRLESAQAFLDQCRLLAQLSGSVYHILLLIKVIQAEVRLHFS